MLLVGPALRRACRLPGKLPRLAVVNDYWGVKVTRYDPGLAAFSQLPPGQFDGVICTDVLEHCPEDDLPWIVNELFSFSRRFVYGSIFLVAPPTSGCQMARMRIARFGRRSGARG